MGISFGESSDFRDSECRSGETKVRRNRVRRKQGPAAREGTWPRRLREQELWGEEIVRIVALIRASSTARQELLRNPNRRNRRKKRKREPRSEMKARNYRPGLLFAARQCGFGPC